MKAKQLRKIAKEIEPWHEFNEVTATYVNYGTESKPDYHPIVNPIRMKDCGRKAYKLMKRIES